MHQQYGRFAYNYFIKEAFNTGPQANVSRFFVRLPALPID